MATPNYSFIKRQKDLAKKAKKEEKKQAKLRGDVSADVDADESLSIEATTSDNLGSDGKELPN
jgi:hypothetical protein